MFEKANWEKFQKESDRYLSQIGDDLDTETLDNEIKKGIILAAIESIPKSKGKGKRKAMPWWDDKCKDAVKNRNKAF